MASAMPGGSAPKSAEYVKSVGRGFHAKVPGLDGLIDLAHPAATVHLGPDTMYDANDGTPMVNLHKAFHGGGLPPRLVSLIEEAASVLTQLADAMDYAQSDRAMPTAMDEQEEPEMGMPGGSMAA